MDTTCIDDLLSLLTLTIIADNRIFAQEIEVFLHASVTLQAELGFEPALGHAQLLTWFEDNRERISSLLTLADFEAALGGILARLAHLPDKTPILDQMHAISIADEEMHISETALITLAARHWCTQSAI